MNTYKIFAALLVACVASMSDAQTCCPRGCKKPGYPVPPGPLCNPCKTYPTTCP